MRKFITLIAILSACHSFAQTTATNWTATDCNSISHTLFNTLDSGKVVVLTWIMPCGMCDAGSKQAWDAAQSFATSHPGKVVFYLVDDFGNMPCAQLASYASTNGIGPANLTIFGNAGIPIDEDDYGGTGMPHVVVIGPDHEIYFNKKNSQAADQPGITTAINSALAALTVNETKGSVQLSISPNPAKDNVTVSYGKPLEKISVLSISGQVVLDKAIAKGRTTTTIDVSSLAPGNYMLKVTTAEGSSVTRKITKQ